MWQIKNLAKNKTKVDFKNPQKKKDFYQTYAEASQAAQKLGIQSLEEYKKRHQEDPRLPASPYSQYSHAGWQNWKVFLGKEKKDFYQTYADASQAAQRLGIKGKEEYFLNHKYKEDAHLPANPSVRYAGKGWEGWEKFLGKEKIEKRDLYESYNEASQAVQKLGIKSYIEYKEKYHIDPRLPSNPSLTYADQGWINMGSFLGLENIKTKRKASMFYESYTEAFAVIQKLGIKNKRQYIQAYRTDSRLPAVPNKFYRNKGWEGWDIFLGKEKSKRIDLYESYAEASQAAQKMGIQSGSDYLKKYKTDPRLPGMPETKYKEKGWINWYHFLGKEDPVWRYIPAYKNFIVWLRDFNQQVVLKPFLIILDSTGSLSLRKKIYLAHNLKQQKITLVPVKDSQDTPYYFYVLLNWPVPIEELMQEDWEQKSENKAKLDLNKAIGLLIYNRSQKKLVFKNFGN